MVNSLLRLKARDLRRRGVSIKKIAQYLKVSRSSASVWVRDIILSIEQLEGLRQSSLEGAERGRLKSALLQKEKRVRRMEEFKKIGIETIGYLTERELLIVGIALYWGEGYKKGRRLQFCNSDPTMIKFLLKWLRVCFSVDSEDIRCRVGINMIHKKREIIVREYWAKMTGIPLNQFTTTSFKKVQNKKVYENFNNYYGTLSVEVRRPARFYGKIIGLIEGLSQANVAH
jgi:hypothetical protein